MNVTWFEQGEAKGRRATLRDQLEERFGPLPPHVLDRLEQLPAERLVQLTPAVLRANSLQELGLDK